MASHSSNIAARVDTSSEQGYPMLSVYTRSETFNIAAFELSTAPLLGPVQSKKIHNHMRLRCFQGIVSQESSPKTYPFDTFTDAVLPADEELSDAP